MSLLDEIKLMKMYLITDSPPALSTSILTRCLTPLVSLSDIFQWRYSHEANAKLLM